MLSQSITRYSPEFVKSTAEIYNDTKVPPVELVKILNRFNSGVSEPFRFFTIPDRKHIQVFATPNEFTPEYYADKVKMALCGASSKNVTGVCEIINTISFPESCCTEIAILFHESMISNVEEVGMYYNILKRISRGEQISCMVHDISIREFTNPRKFDNTIIETKQNREIRWLHSNLLILSHMCVIGKCPEFIGIIVVALKSVNSDTIDYMVKIMRDVLANMSSWIANHYSEYLKEISEINEQLQCIQESTVFRLTHKIQLRELTTSYLAITHAT